MGSAMRAASTISTASVASSMNEGAYSGATPEASLRWAHMRNRLLGKENGQASLSIWAFRFLLWYICVMLVQPQNRYTFLWPLHIADLTFIGALILHGLNCVRDRRPFIALNGATVFGLILIGLTFASNTFGVFQDGWGGWNPIIDTYVKNCLLLIMVGTFCTSVERVWALQMTVLFCTLWWVKSGIRLAAAGATLSGDRLMGAAIGLIENPNSFAYMMCIMIPLYLYGFQHALRKWQKLAFLACALASVYIVFQTGSRTGLVTLIVLGTYLLRHYGRGHWKTIGIAVIAIVLLFPLTGEKNLRRFKTIPHSAIAFLGLSRDEDRLDYGRPLNQDEQSADERSSKNRDTWHLVKAYPLFGVGLVPQARRLLDEGFGMAGIGQVHCEILMVGKQMGMLGISLYVMALAMSWWNGRKAIKWGQQHGWSAIGNMGQIFQAQAIAIAVGGFFCPAPWHPPMMIMLGSSVALVNAMSSVPAPRSPAPLS